MSEPNVRLKPNVKLEPLVAQWYAWHFLIAPATAALTLRRKYVDILASYIKAPQVHVNAVKNPALRGGPFLDLPASEVDRAQALLQETQAACADLTALADAITACQAMLRSKAKGGGMQNLYREVPPALRGYVELVYDTGNSPEIRLIEPLLYRSKYFKKSLQSILISPIDTDARPFVYSTPRFVMNPQTEMEWKVPFDDARVDYLARLRESPRPYGEVIETLGLESEEALALKQFLTEEPASKRDNRRYRGPGVRIRYFGHACLLIETAEVAILTDPVLSYDYPSPIERFTLADLPDEIDYVLLTHAHSDHMSFEWLLQLRHKIRHIVFPQNEAGFLPDPSLRLMLQALGFTSTIALEELNNIELPEGQIISIPFFGEHGDLNIRSKTAYAVSLKGRQLLLAADSNNLEESLYDHVRAEFGPVDTTFIGMECEGAPVSWVYGHVLPQRLERQFDQERRLDGSNSKRASAIVKALGCKSAYVYAMGMEPWLSHITALAYTAESPQMIESDKFIAECRGAGMQTGRPFGKAEWVLT